MAPLAPKLAPNALAQRGMERDRGSVQERESRRKPHVPVRDWIGRHTRRPYPGKGAVVRVAAGRSHPHIRDYAAL